MFGYNIFPSDKPNNAYIKQVRILPDGKSKPYHGILEVVITNDVSDILRNPKLAEQYRWDEKPFMYSDIVKEVTRKIPNVRTIEDIKGMQP